MFATSQDVAIEMGAPLTAEQVDTATAKIAALEASIRLRYPDMAARAVQNPDLMTVVKQVVATAVARALRNPDGKIQETIDDYTFRRADTADGSLTLTDEEWATLAATPAPHGAATAFTVSPQGQRSPDRLFDYYAPDIYGEVIW